jgi:hypothetical protein
MFLVSFMFPPFVLSKVITGNSFLSQLFWIVLFPEQIYDALGLSKWNSCFFSFWKQYQC